jgi:hypothetical protein
MLWAKKFKMHFHSLQDSKGKSAVERERERESEVSPFNFDNFSLEGTFFQRFCGDGDGGEKGVTFFTPFDSNSESEYEHDDDLRSWEWELHNVTSVGS